MRKGLHSLPILTALLVACGGGTPTTPQADSVTITGSDKLRIESPAQVTATVKDATGRTINKPVSWSSSHPEIVSVDASGKLIVKRFNSSPVTLKATVDGKQGTMNVFTYGLEASGGTYHYTPTGDVGSIMLARFRDANGAGVPQNTTYSVTGPAGFNGGEAADLTIHADSSSAFGYSPFIAPVSGEYTAKVVVNGVTYTKKFRIDATKTLGGVLNSKVTLTRNAMTVEGTLPAGAVLVDAGAYPLNSETEYFTDYTDRLPYSYTWPEPLPGGVTYGTGIYAYDFGGESSFHQQTNMSYTAGVDQPL